MYGNEQNGDSVQSWQGENVNGNDQGHYNDPQIEQELPPIGIKEDG